MPCPKPDQFSTNDLMQIVTYRAEVWVTRHISEEAKEFIFRAVDTYPEQALINAYHLLRNFNVRQ